MGSERECQLPLPVVDFCDENLKPGTDTWVSACDVVRGALEDHGGFLALYNKVDPLLYDSVFSAMEQLFDLPLEDKMQHSTDKVAMQGNALIFLCLNPWPLTIH